MMLVLVTYDVSTGDKAGQRRLRQVAKICLNHGQRVQNSVFECTLRQENFVNLKQQLLGVIQEDQDSLRFYFLGSNWEYKVEHFGVKPSLNMEDPLII
jgi:CRISPR-associated protein Cas2